MSGKATRLFFVKRRTYRLAAVVAVLEMGLLICSDAVAGSAGLPQEPQQIPAEARSTGVADGSSSEDQGDLAVAPKLKDTPEAATTPSPTPPQSRTGPPAQTPTPVPPTTIPTPEDPVQTLAGLCPNLGSAPIRELLSFTNQRRAAHACDLGGDLFANKGEPFFNKLREEVRLCLPKVAADSHRQQKEILDGLDVCLSEALMVFDTERLLRQKAEEVVRLLRKLVWSEIANHEWPPDDLVPRVADGLGSLVAIREWIETFRKDPPILHLGEAQASTNHLEKRHRLFCGHRRRLLSIDMTEADRVAHYYSWTATRQVYDFTVSSLKNDKIDSWCRRR